MTSLAKMTPEEIDSLLFPLWAARWQNARYLANYRELVAFDLFGVSPRPRPIRAHGSLGAWCEKIQELEAKDDDLLAEMAVYEAEFARRGGWMRYVLCGARNGHLHYDQCSTLRWNTELLLIPQASGLDASDVVGKFGETACTKCFPDAPVYAPAPDLTACPGTGLSPVEGTVTARYTSSYGECPTCGTRQIVTASYRMRKHKKESA